MTNAKYNIKSAVFGGITRVIIFLLSKKHTTPQLVMIINTRTPPTERTWRHRLFLVETLVRHVVQGS